MKSIGKRIRRIRKAKLLSAPDLAKLMGVSKQMMFRYETGKSAMKLELVSRAAKILDVSMSSLVDKEVEVDDGTQLLLFLYDKLPLEEKSKIIVQLHKKLSELGISYVGLSEF